MVSQELVNAVMQERARQAAEVQRIKDAQGKQGQGVAPRSGLSTKRIKRPSFLSCVTSGCRTASAS